MANAMDVGPDGLLYFPVMGANEIWRIDPDAGGTPEVVATELGVPDSVKFDSEGYIVSTQAHSGQVLRIDPRTGAKTVLADLYLLDIEHAPQWRKDRNLVLQFSQLRRSDGRKARITRSRIRRHIAHGINQRLYGSDVSDASAEFPILVDGDESAAVLLQRRRCGRRLVLLALPHCGFCGLAGNA